MFFANLVLLIVVAAGWAESRVYVSLKSADTLAIYSEDETTGLLMLAATETVEGGPASIAVTADKRRMYIARRRDKKIACYSIDQKTGRLSFLSEINAVDDPVYIALDRTERYLLSAYFGASKIAIYPICKDGSLGNNPVFEEGTPDHPHAVQVNERNDVLYVTCMSGDRILQYRFRPETGTAVAFSPVVTADGTGPRHFIFAPDNEYLFVANEVASSVTAYKILQGGELLEAETLSTLPVDYSGANTCADIHITPDGTFLYVTNRGADTIAGYKINGDKTLSLIGFFATEATPREMVIDAAGRYLFALGESSGRLQSYKIDPVTGALAPLQNIAVGAGPVWIEVVKVD